MPPHAEAGDAFGLPEYSLSRVRGELVQVKTDSRDVSEEDFRSIKHIGNGDMGSVFLVELRSTRTIYAMKVMKKERIAARKNGHRVSTEKEILATVKHPFLPTLLAHFENEKHTFLVMNFCPGGDLNVLRQRQPDNKFSECACRFYTAEVLLALEYLHSRGIVYRDLKPENILIQADGHLLLTDFDLSSNLWQRASQPGRKPGPRLIPLEEPKRRKRISRLEQMKAILSCGSSRDLLGKGPKLSKTKSRIMPGMGDSFGLKKAAKGRASEGGQAFSFVGTEEYVAPEVIWGKGHGFPVDWWTFGILLYELYYGKTPFKGANRKETFYNVLCRPAEYPGPQNSLVDLIQKLLVKEPENRLGAIAGAEEIKKHPFFDGVSWEGLQYLSRPPVVPAPFNLEDVERERERRRKAGEDVVPDDWFCRSTSVKNISINRQKSRGHGDLKLPPKFDVVNPDREDVDEAAQVQSSGEVVSVLKDFSELQEPASQAEEQAVPDGVQDAELFQIKSLEQVTWFGHDRENDRSDVNLFSDVF